MDYLDYEVRDMLDALDGHENEQRMKIKLADGRTLPISGIQYLHPCLGGDDILYVRELDPLWIKYHKEVESIAYNLFHVAQKLDNVIKSRVITDTDWALDAMMTVARECDYWLDKLNIKHDLGPLTGADNEIFDKIELLNDWVKSY